MISSTNDVQLPDITSIAIVGLGYVGLPLALAFSAHYSVIGFDVDTDKVEKAGADNPGKKNICFTTDAESLRKADVFIVAVPIPSCSSQICPASA